MWEENPPKRELVFWQIEKLIRSNAMKYNRSDSSVHKVAERLSALCRERISSSFIRGRWHSRDPTDDFQPKYKSLSRDKLTYRKYSKTTRKQFWNNAKDLIEKEFVLKVLEKNVR